MLTPSQQAIVDEVDAITDRLARITTRAEVQTRDMEKAENLEGTLRFWFMLRAAHEKLDAARTVLDTGLLERISRKVVPEMLDRRGQGGSITLKDVGVRFTTQQRVSCSFVDKEGGMNWLRENGLESLIQPQVASSTLAAWGKDYSSENMKDPPEEFFKMGYLRYTSATKVKMK